MPGSSDFPQLEPGRRCGVEVAECKAGEMLTRFEQRLPPDLFKGPRMVPWRFIMLGAAALAMLLLIHLATLFGAERPPWVSGV